MPYGTEKLEWLGYLIISRLLIDVRCTFVFLLSSFIFYVLGFKLGFYGMLVCLLSFTFLYVFITCIAAFVRNKLMMMMMMIVKKFWRLLLLLLLLRMNVIATL